MQRFSIIYKPNLKMILSICIAMSLCPLLVVLAQDMEKEAIVKSGFIYYTSFFIYDKNKVSSSEPIKICSLGESLVTREIRLAFQGKKIKNRSTEFFAFDDKAIDNKEQAIFACDVAYIPQSILDKKQLGELGIKTISFTVSDHPKMLDKGGMVYMYVEDNRIKYEVNVDKIREVGLFASSEFLAHARFVIQKGVPVYNK